MAGTTVPSMFAGLPNDLIINIVKQEHRRSMVEESKNNFSKVVDKINRVGAAGAAGQHGAAGGALNTMASSGHIRRRPFDFEEFWSKNLAFTGQELEEWGFNVYEVLQNIGYDSIWVLWGS